MHQGICHCGAIQFVLKQPPKQLVDCNCSICRRIGALWGHVPIEEVEIIADPAASSAYSHGDRAIAFHSCKGCGCTTHWENLQADGEHMAVNFRMCDPDQLEGLQIRKFDGADSWKFLD